MAALRDQPTLWFTQRSARIAMSHHHNLSQEGGERERERERGREPREGIDGAAAFWSPTLGTNGRIKENGCSKDLELIMRLARDGATDGRREERKGEKEDEGREMCISLLLSSPLLRQ